MVSLEVMALLPDVLPGIQVTHADRQVALLHDVLETTAVNEIRTLASTTERTSPKAGGRPTRPCGPAIPPSRAGRSFGPGGVPARVVRS